MRQFTVRVPNELRERLFATAAADRRSVTRLLEVILPAGLAAVEVAELPIPEAPSAIRGTNVRLEPNTLGRILEIAEERGVSPSAVFNHAADVALVAHTLPTLTTARSA